MKNFFIINLIFMFVACSQDLPFSEIQNEKEQSIDISSNAEAMKRFAIILSKAVSNDPNIRKFVKQEAIKQINKDYDIFYPFIKNEIVYDNKTFKELLIQYEMYEGEIQQIEELSPVLTIYVAELPNEINADTWDSENEIPYVVYEFLDEGKQLFYKNGSVEYEFRPTQFPQFTTLVIKRNERIKLKSDVLKTRANEVFEPEQYEFIDDFFNPNIETKALPRDPIYTPAFRDIDPDIVPNGIRAYNAMGVSGYNWQRDNIYYGMNLNSEKGVLDRSIRERIKSINFTKQGYYAMCDWNNPDEIRSLFVEGRYELKIDVSVSSTSGLGNVITKYVNCWFEELFGYIDYIWVGPTIEARAMKFDHWIPVDIILPTWDLETTAFQWKISIQEVDAQETITRTEEITSEFATNFSGSAEKIGLQFGASAKRTIKNVFTIVTHRDSDDLGTVEISFSDPVLLGPSTYYVVNYLYPNYWDAYSTGNGYYNVVMCPYKAY